jgi:hypothetical protein
MNLAFKWEKVSIVYSGKVNNSVSTIGKTVTLPIKKSIEESLMKENRFINIEVEALKQQLRDINQVIERIFI